MFAMNFGLFALENKIISMIFRGSSRIVAGNLIILYHKHRGKHGDLSSLGKNDPESIKVVMELLNQKFPEITALIYGN